MGAYFTRAQNVDLDRISTKTGYLAHLLINETPFPGERAYRSEADTQAAMLAVLWVLHSRIRFIPNGYSQQGLASTSSQDIIDVITAGGIKGQVDGFYRDDQGQFMAVERVTQRVNYLVELANQGNPGKVARLLNHAQQLANAYFHMGPDGRDIFAELSKIGPTAVTGRSYSWMTDLHQFTPGGDFIRIPDDQHGALGGNRFFTLKRKRH
jgi:hypothetical protein